MIKCVKLSSDGRLCLSAGSDGTLRLWDIGSRKCINVYGNQRKKRNTIVYHTDSIWTIDVTSKFDYAYTGGRDGNIFKIDLLNEEVSVISNGSDKHPIISLKYDETY
jgi:WD repeat-containing protein 48